MIMGTAMKFMAKNAILTILLLLTAKKCVLLVITTKNFVIKINIKQYVMIMGTAMKFTIFTAAEKTNTAAILATKIFHESLMKFLA